MVYVLWTRVFLWSVIASWVSPVFTWGELRAARTELWNRHLCRVGRMQCSKDSNYKRKPCVVWSEFRSFLLNHHVDDKTKLSSAEDKKKKHSVSFNVVKINDKMTINVQKSFWILTTWPLETILTTFHYTKSKVTIKMCNGQGYSTVWDNTLLED